MHRNGTEYGTFEWKCNQNKLSNHQSIDLFDDDDDDFLDRNFYDPFYILEI